MSGTILPLIWSIIGHNCKYLGGNILLTYITNDGAKIHYEINYAFKGERSLSFTTAVSNISFWPIELLTQCQRGR